MRLVVRTIGEDGLDWRFELRKGQLLGRHSVFGERRWGVEGG